MHTQIINTPLTLNIYGFGASVINKNYAGTAFSLMDKMWKIVKANGLKNKGLNIWVYEQNDQVFAGVELEDAPPPGTGLHQKTVTLAKYAYYKHTGPYNLIKQAGQSMQKEIQGIGFETTLPYVEIYGHWTSDESKLETELLACIK